MAFDQQWHKCNITLAQQCQLCGQDIGDKWHGTTNVIFEQMAFVQTWHFCQDISATWHDICPTMTMPSDKCYMTFG